MEHHETFVDRMIDRTLAPLDKAAADVQELLDNDPEQEDYTFEYRREVNRAELRALLLIHYDLDSIAAILRAAFTPNSPQPREKR